MSRSCKIDDSKPPPLEGVGGGRKIETMKKFISIFILTLMASTAISQVNTNLVVGNNPPGTLIEWGTKKEILTYILVNQGQPRQVLLKTTITLTDGTPVATTNLALARPYTLERGFNTILSAIDVMPLQIMVFTGRFKNVMEKTGKLPAGTYQICVQPVNPADLLPVGENRCRIFTIAAFQLPILVLPADEGVLDMVMAKTAITFRWTPVSPRPAQPVMYRVLVFEILENQNPLQALRSNKPLLSKDVIGTTQYIWQPQLPFMPLQVLDANDESQFQNIPAIAGRFVWTVQSFDNNGVPFGDGNINGDGISEPYSFVVGDKDFTLKHRLLESTSVMADMDGNGSFENNLGKELAHQLIVDNKGEPVAPETRAGVSTSRSNIPRANVSKMKEGDDTTNNQQKAGVSTSRSNIRTHINGFILNSDGSYNGDGEAIIDGKVVAVKIRYRVKPLDIKVMR
jgi:hypothetical protein